MFINAGDPTLATVSCRLVRKDTGGQIHGIEIWDTTQQEEYRYTTQKRPEVITEFTITRNQLEALEHEYGGKELLNQDIADNKVIISFINDTKCIIN